jgi:hypothetical protein
VIRLVRGVCRLTGTPINRSIEHGLHGARSRALFFTVHPRAAWETSAAQGSSRCLDLGGGRCYSLTPASADAIPMHPLPRLAVTPSGTAPELCGAATPCGALDADSPRLVVVLRRLEEPSPKSSRPLTSIVARGHHRFGSKPTGSYRPTRLS